MSRIKHLLLIAFLFISGSAHAINNYQDWWWNPAQSGMGLNVGQQNDTIFVAWFNYGDDTKASFLTMGGVLNGNTLSGTLYRGTGPVPGPNYNPAQVKQTAVGTATITFNSNNDATLTYSYDNKGGTMALQRFSFASPNLNQSWTVLNTSTTSGCTNSSLNGSTAKIQNIKSQMGLGSNFTFSISDLDGSSLCIAAMSLQPSGSRGVAVGAAACEGGVSANMTFDDLSAQSDYLNFSFTASGMSADKTCMQKGYMSGVVNKDALPSYDFKTAFQNRILKGSSKTFNVSGDCKGTFSITDSPAAKTTWNGQSVYAVGTTEIVSIPNCPIGISGTQTSITYYDMNFVELAKSHSDGTYSEYVKTSQPNSVKVGETGTLGTWTHWNNTSKSEKYEIDIHSYIVEADTPTSVIFNMIDRTYPARTNQLEITSQIRFRLSSTGVLEWYSATIDFANNKGHLVMQ
jgi:hypothetical protein